MYIYASIFYSFNTVRKTKSVVALSRHCLRMKQANGTELENFKTIIVDYALRQVFLLVVKAFKFFLYAVFVLFERAFSPDIPISRTGFFCWFRKPITLLLYKDVTEKIKKRGKIYTGCV
jgi:hypothetical protein